MVCADMTKYSLVQMRSGAIYDLMNLTNIGDFTLKRNTQPSEGISLTI